MNDGSPFTVYRLRPLQRQVDPEWLDDLPADDPRAVRSRMDLRRVNGVMGHARIIRSALRGRLPGSGARVAELGAGDGTLLLSVLPKLGDCRRTRLVFVDRQPVVSGETIRRYAEHGCSATIDAADVFDWLAHQTLVFDVIVANLFLHHFKPPELTRLLALAACRTRLFAACEPRRARMPLAGSRMLGLIGCNDVTRHDAHLSVRAGFTDQELSALWPADSSWTLAEGRAGLFSHLFTAVSVNRER